VAHAKAIEEIRALRAEQAAGKAAGAAS